MTVAATVEVAAGPPLALRPRARVALAVLAAAWLASSACAAWGQAGPAPATPAEVLRDGAETAQALGMAWTVWYVRAAGTATTSEAVDALAGADARFAALLWDYRRSVAARAQGQPADPDGALGRVLALLRAYDVELPAPWQ